MRERFIFRGHVQGVGFRARAWSVSRGFDVSGYVRNLPDGSVELVAEGTDLEVEQYLAALLAEMDGRVRGVERAALDASGEHLAGFTIRH